MGSPFSNKASRGPKFLNRLKLETPDLSYADLHSEVMKDVDDMLPTAPWLHQKQRLGSKATGSEELVKYMSRLPGYLEKGENRQEKALSVGVLDWRSLEKWQYNHKPICRRSNRYSPSSSNTSSVFSTDGSSNRSSISHSCSPAHSKMRRPSLQSHFNASPRECDRENIGNFLDYEGVLRNPLKEQQTILRTYQPPHENPPEIKLKEYKRKDSDQQSIPPVKTLHDVEKYGGASSSKVKVMNQDSEAKKEMGKLHDPYYNIIPRDCPDRHKTVVLLLPRDEHKSSHFEISYALDSTEIVGRRSVKSSGRSFLEESHSKEFYHRERYSNISSSCPLPSEVDRDSQREPPMSPDASSDKCSSDPSQSSQEPAKVSISSSTRKILENESTIIPRSSNEIKSSKESDLKMGTGAATKLRNPSPTRRYSMSKSGRSSTSKENGTVLLSPSKHVTYRCRTAEASGCSNYLSADNPNATSRAHSSPLRRLLDPLLKPRTAHSHQSSEQLQKDSPSRDRGSKSSGGQGESSTVRSVKVKLDLKGFKTTNIDGSHHNEKHGSSTVQAYVQIAVKNGLPLFTFAVDNSRDILAAMMRRLSSSVKDEATRIYTLFTIREMKKKKVSWLIQGGKGKDHDYIPNVVAQMKVSDPTLPNLSGQPTDQFGIREFVLFAVNLRQFDQQTSDLQPNDELAAIVVKFPRSGNQSYKSNNLSTVRLKESVPDNGMSIGNHNIFSTTVILPGGVHGVPSKGEPSPLIERWKSGGVCDCGGWDLGCRIRVLANQTQFLTKSSSIRAHQPIFQFELFPQCDGLTMADVLTNGPIFSLSALQNGIYSVEFNSSLTVLQAFSICIALFDCRPPSELLELSNLFEDKLLEEATLQGCDGIKLPKQAQVEVPARCAAMFPPFSPVERV